MLDRLFGMAASAAAGGSSCRVGKDGVAAGSLQTGTQAWADAGFGGGLQPGAQPWAETGPPASSTIPPGAADAWLAALDGGRDAGGGGGACDGGNG